MLHPSTHSREIWTTFGKTWALKASFSARCPQNLTARLHTRPHT